MNISSSNLLNSSSSDNDSKTSRKLLALLHYSIALVSSLILLISLVSIDLFDISSSTSSLKCKNLSGCVAHKKRKKTVRVQACSGQVTVNLTNETCTCTDTIDKGACFHLIREAIIKKFQLPGMKSLDKFSILYIVKNKNKTVETGSDSSFSDNEILNNNNPEETEHVASNPISNIDIIIIIIIITVKHKTKTEPL